MSLQDFPVDKTVKHVLKKLHGSNIKYINKDAYITDTSDLLKHFAFLIDNLCGRGISIHVESILYHDWYEEDFDNNDLLSWSGDKTVLKFDVANFNFEDLNTTRKKLFDVFATTIANGNINENIEYRIVRALTEPFMTKNILEVKDILQRYKHKFFDKIYFTKKLIIKILS